MKNKITFLIVSFSFVILFAVICFENICFKKINTVEKENNPAESPEENEASNNPIERLKFEYDMQKDPKTGLIPQDIKIKEKIISDNIPLKEEYYNPDNFNNYLFQGPDNIGGRTRAAVYDKYNASNILAGGISSGIFRSEDGGNTWTNVTPNGEIHNVSCIVQDPRPGYSMTWYYGTGEFSGLGSSAAIYGGAHYLGSGIYKSTDNGLTWNVLQSTLGSYSSFGIVNRMVISPIDGKVYAATHREIKSSTDGGRLWITELGIFQGILNVSTTDIAVNSAGTLIAGFDGNCGVGNIAPYPPNDEIGGVWIKQVNNAFWDHIAREVNDTTFIPDDWDKFGYGRVVVTGTSDNNIFYVLYKNHWYTDCLATIRIEADLFKYDLATGTWSPNRTANLPGNEGAINDCLIGNSPFAVQRGYDLTIASKPDNPDIVFIGGTSAYRSSNGFAAKNGVLIGGYKQTTDYTFYLNHHPDIHSFFFHPTNPDKMICGSDGGVHITDNVNASPVVWTPKNTGYVTSQFYRVALSPDNFSNTAIGGMQDNGSSETTGGLNHTILNGADGCSVGISKPTGGNTFYYFSSQKGKIFRKNITLGTPAVDIKPQGSDSGVFVTYFLLDPDNTEYLYYVSYNKLYRTANASTVTTAVDGNNWTEMTGIGNTLLGNISAMAVNHNGGTRLYIGTNTGSIYRLNNPRTAAANTPPDFINGNITFPAYISDIAVNPTNENRVMTVFSSYGIHNNVMFTDNANAGSPTWHNFTGNLYDASLSTAPSIRSCKIVNSGINTEFYVGTSIGLFSSIFYPPQDNSIWVREGASTIKKSLVSSLDYRPSDNKLLVGTHGNGIFSANILGTVVSNKVYVTPNPANYNSVKAAFDAINAGTHTNGAITVKINANTNETEPAILNSGVFTSCLIQPSGYVTVSGSFDDAVMVLNGADNVVIDGRAGGTGYSNNLTIMNSGFGLNSGTIRISNGAVNNVIKYVNCILENANANVNGGRNINIAQSAAGTGGNNNNAVENCVINGGRRGIQTFGTTGAAGFTNDNCQIKNNIVKNCTALGIFIGSETKDNTVEGNEIYNDEGVTTDVNFRAINVQGLGTTSVRKNRIRDINSDTTNYSFTGIITIPIATTITGVINSAVVNIENNFVSICDENPVASYIYGIYITSNINTVPSYTANVYFNTVRIGGISSNGIADDSRGIQVGLSGNNSVYNQLNNVVLNYRTGGNNSSYHIGSNISNSAGVTYNLDYNVYKSIDDNGKGWDAGWNGFVYKGIIGLATYQTASDMEKKTAFQDVNLRSFTDLHLHYQVPAKMNAKPIAGITTDIDNQNRNLTHPYRGADEYDTALKVLVLKVGVQTEGCGGGNDSFTVELRNSNAPCNILDFGSQNSDALGFARFTFALDYSGSFYIAVKHINSIVTYNAMPLIYSTDSITYDFRTSQSQAYGSNMVFANGAWSLYSGDVNQDGVIDATDGLLIDNDAYIFLTGQNLASDLNCDETVDGSDIALADNNAFNFITSVIPFGCSSPVFNIMHESFNNDKNVFSKEIIEKNIFYKPADLSDE